MTGRLITAWLATLLFFGIWPGIDIWVSGLFFDEADARFPLADSGLLEFLRNVIWNAANLAVLMALIFGAHALFATRMTAVPGRVWGFILLLVLLGPVLIVNVILKGYWGRARPADTDIFGGPLPFSPPWEIAGNCPSNCSFVSGEAAAVTCLAIILAILLWQRVSDRRKLIYWLIALVVIGASMRVLKGRHYLSDVIWSVLMMCTLAHVLAQRMNIRSATERVSWDAIRADGMRIWSAIKNWRGG